MLSYFEPLSSVHFEGGFNFLDLFLPGRGLASDSRGRCFLWMMFYYLERPEDDNPFHDKYSRSHSPKAPLLCPLTGEELEGENVDTPEEIEWGHKMSAQRNAFLQRLVASLEREKREKNHPSFDGTATISVMKSKRPMAELENLSGQPSARSVRPEATQSPSEKNFVNYMPDPQKRENRRGMLSSLPLACHVLTTVSRANTSQSRTAPRIGAGPTPRFSTRETTG